MMKKIQLYLELRLLHEAWSFSLKEVTRHYFLVYTWMFDYKVDASREPPQLYPKPKYADTFINNHKRLQEKNYIASKATVKSNIVNSPAYEW